MNEFVFKSASLQKWVKSVFTHFHFSDTEAETAAAVLLQADLRGIDSHGVARLSGYVRLIEKSRINPQPKMKLLRETPSTATLDADAAVGLVSAPFAMQVAIEKAEKCGSGWVAVSNSNHFGIAAHHTMLALPHNMIGFAMTNASPLVTPAMGAERMLGTNPICVAIPAGEEPPFVLDMATSAASNGKLEIAERKQKEIPGGWLVKNDGSESHNPAELKQGGMLLTLGSDMDHGSYKGYGLSAWVDIFSGVLSGANFGPWVPPFVSFLDPSPDAPGKGIGHFVGAWRVDGFREVSEFKQQMDLWIRRFRNTKPAAGIPVGIPGDFERKTAEEREVNGIPLIDKVIDDLKQIADKTGLPLPEFS
ncbi:MAG: Ldh family oxidoreductase [Bacteroidetes bacterium]|nr:Ldh family oxidoreductase [Bacteroidota bacterium]